MTSRDWDFAFGDLGDPLADIEWWMTPPFPEYMILELREQQLNKKEVKSDD